MTESQLVNVTIIMMEHLWCDFVVLIQKWLLFINATSVL